MVEKNDYVIIQLQIQFVLCKSFYYIFFIQCIRNWVFFPGKKEITRLWTSLKPLRKTWKINLGSFVFESFFTQNEPFVAENLDQKGNKGKFISNFKS